MANFSPNDVMTLHKKSGLGLMECKVALQKADGDMTVAKDHIRKKGLSNMDGRVDREASEGCIAVAFSDDRSKCAIVEINTETDFTAKNDDFVAMATEIAEMALNQPTGAVEQTDVMQTRIDDLRVTTKENVMWRRGFVLGAGRLGAYVHHDRKTGVVVEIDGDVDDETIRNLCLHVTSVDPARLGVTDDDIPKQVLAKEREIAKAQALASGKPENIVEKMVDGKIRKFLDGVVLLRQSLVMEDTTQIKDVLPNGATIRQFVKYKVGE